MNTFSPHPNLRISEAACGIDMPKGAWTQINAALDRFLESRGLSRKTDTFFGQKQSRIPEGRAA